MLKKVLLFLWIFILFSSYVFADIWSVDDYYLFFQNKSSGEQKYFKATFGEWSVFNIHLLDYLDWSSIWWESKLENWKLVGLKTVYTEEEKIIEQFSNTWTIEVWSSGIRNDNSPDTWTSLDQDRLKILTPQDFSNKENVIIYSWVFFELFGWLFLLCLPLNIITFSCFGFLLFLLYEKYRYNLFKNLYLNSLIIYLISYLFLIFNGMSYAEVSSGWVFWSAAYLLFVWVPKFVLFLVSLFVLGKYHKKHPDTKKIYKFIVYWYCSLFLLVILTSFILKVFR
jgi:hypothetical protein